MFSSESTTGLKAGRVRRGMMGLAVSVIAPAACVMAPAAWAQAPMMTLAANDLPAAPSAVARLDGQGVTPVASAGPVAGFSVDHATADAMPLRLDEAIALGVKNNARLAIQKQQERYVSGEILTVGNALLPTLTASAYTRAQQINLAAMGFKPGTLANIPGFSDFQISEIVKVNTTNAQLSLSQAVFNVPAYYLFRAAQKAGTAAKAATADSRDSVVLSVGTQYLQTLADQAQIANAKALLMQDMDVLRHAKAQQDAGVGVHIDTLRAQVEVQQQQQALIADENTFAKDKIALNRVMGIAADQPLTLVDTVPFEDLDELSVEEARSLAFTRREDLQSLVAQQEVANQARKAIKYQYVPVVGVNGFYGVLGQTTGSYHGDFLAAGTVKFPIFDEGQLRGQREVAAAQAVALRQQVAGLKTQIEAEIRTSMLDVESSKELVKVARSNVTLSEQVLNDATERFNAGVDDSLPVARAQASLAGAEARVVQTEFQYNQAKLQLARRTGVIDTDYKAYLGR
jgi:outer membrane protein TolC